MAKSNFRYLSKQHYQDTTQCTFKYHCKAAMLN